MKQQFRFLIAGFSLIGLLVYTATPASAQADTTKFSVTLMSLSVTVTPNTIAIGQVSAGDTKESPTQGQSITVNLGGASVLWYAAGTNTKETGDTNNAVVWRLVKGVPGENEFKMCVKTGSPVATTCLAGPTIGADVPSDKFPIIGPIEPLGAAIGSQTVNWEFGAPTTSQNNKAQEFNIQFAAAVSGTNLSAVNQIFQSSSSTELTTSGATSPLP